MDAAWVLLQDEAVTVAERRGLQIAGRANSRVPAVRIADAFVELVESAAAERGVSCQRLPSGAGHDAQVLAVVGPVAMIFVPSAAGVSHSPQEHTDPDDLIAGARVLMGALLAADALIDEVE
jgi:N-carbamoyl-L-amino-acid hydrolase